MGVQVATQLDQIGELLVSAGLITKDDLRRAKKNQQETADRLVNILITQGSLDSRAFVKFLAEPGQTPGVELRNFDIDSKVLGLVPKNFALLHRVVPVDHRGSELIVATAQPLDSTTVLALEEHTGLRVKPLLCSKDDVEASLERHYGDDPSLAHDVDTLEGPLKLKSAVTMLRNIESLPALPGTVHRVRELLFVKDGSAAQVGEVVSQDPAMTAKVLRIANSAAYGFSHKVDDIQLGVSLLGLVETYSIVVSTAVINAFDRSRSFDYKGFWLQSMACARLARALAHHVPDQQPGGVFSAGLLHDLGRVALLQIAPGHYDRVDSTLVGSELIAEEERILGLTHAEAGYELAVHWGLPPELAECIRFHHWPEYAADEFAAVVALINVADVAACAYLGDSEGSEIDLIECTESMEALDLSEEQLLEIVESVEKPKASDSLWAGE